MIMKYILCVLILCTLNSAQSQQIADIDYNPIIKNPVYKLKKGPIIYIDEGHYNFHTKNGRYKTFSNLLEQDGYVVKEYKGEFQKDKLEKGSILVISNALNKINASMNSWSLPTPSAFTVAEIQTIKQWVTDGGNLFLIADHMPFPGAAHDLAKEFGFEFSNGFVHGKVSKTLAKFNTDNGTLVESVITKGRSDDETVMQVVSFVGQAFKIPEDATSILQFNEDYINLLPNKAWDFKDSTPKHEVAGWSQGAFKKFGKGKIVVFGEAAMFSAQISGPNKTKMGMNNPIAKENYKLLLNIIHWLDGIL